MWSIILQYTFYTLCVLSVLGSRFNHDVMMESNGSALFTAGAEGQTLHAAQSLNLFEVAEARSCAAVVPLHGIASFMQGRVTQKK